MSKPDTYFPDGFRHGNELPDDLELDRMIYPEREPPPETDTLPWPLGLSFEDYQAEKARREEARQAQNERDDRRFEITEGNVTGQKTGPPRTP